MHTTRRMRFSYEKRNFYAYGIEEFLIYEEFLLTRFSHVEKLREK